MISWWNKIRPDLILPDEKLKSKINPEGTLNSRAYRLGNTGYVQKIKLTAKEKSSTLTVLTFEGVCHAQMKADVYKIRIILNVNDQIVEAVVSSSCSYICGKELGSDALCKHLLALLYALKTVIEIGVV